ncbi:unnamed protein product [Cuscuta campestris]|uniref:Uncharacterized protein n=1 Tax=Cuscuta campestris TaxID=132261 RepID=A0A484L5M7_9ASTE|nr:unnamed protein product [Cuscuta campestris]
MRENPKLTNAFKASKESSSEESSDDSSDSSFTKESNDEEDEEKATRMKYTDFLKWKKYVKRKEVYSKPKKERHKPRNPQNKTVCNFVKKRWRYAQITAGCPVVTGMKKLVNFDVVSTPAHP